MSEARGVRLDDLLREALAAPTDAARAEVAARIAAVDDVLAELDRRLRADDAEPRHLALHFVTRLAPPPPALASGVLHCLRDPLDADPLGDETALVLVACGLLADEVCGFRDVIAARAHAIDRAHGARAPVMRRLARDTLATIDAAIAAAARRRAARIAALAALIAADRDPDARAEIWRDAEAHFYPELVRAGLWEDVAIARRAAGDRDGARRCFACALDDFRWHASGASAGAEGLARMADVHRIERALAGLDR